MPDYRELYHKLFNQMTNTISDLQKAQQECEDIYLASKPSTIVQMKSSNSSKTQDKQE